MTKWMTPLFALVALCFTAGAASAQPSCTLTVTPGAAGTAKLNCQLDWTNCIGAMAEWIDVWDGTSHIVGANSASFMASGSFNFNPGANQGLTSGHTYTVVGSIIDRLGNTIATDSKVVTAP